MATILVPDLFHAEMEIPGFYPFQTSSPFLEVIGMSSAMSTLCVFDVRPFTSAFKVTIHDI